MGDVPNVVEARRPVNRRQSRASCEILRGRWPRRSFSTFSSEEMRAFAVYRFEEGLIVRREAFTTREKALEAAGSSE